MAGYPASAWRDMLAAIAGGQSLAEAAKAPNSPTREAFYKRCEKLPAFKAEYEAARLRRAEGLEERCEAIVADVLADRISANAGKVALNHLQWLMERLDPQRYGAAMKLEHSADSRSYVDVLKDAQERIKGGAAAAVRKRGEGDGGTVVPLHPAG